MRIAGFSLKPIWPSPNYSVKLWFIWAVVVVMKKRSINNLVHQNLSKTPLHILHHHINPVNVFPPWLDKGFRAERICYGAYSQSEEPNGHRERSLTDIDMMKQNLNNEIVPNSRHGNTFRLLHSHFQFTNRRFLCTLFLPTFDLMLFVDSELRILKLLNKYP